MGYPPVAESPFVRMVLDGLQWKLATAKVCKKPVINDMISALVSSLGTTPLLADLRLVAACLLPFSTFLMKCQM